MTYVEFEGTDKEDTYLNGTLQLSSSSSWSDSGAYGTASRITFLGLQRYRFDLVNANSAKIHFEDCVFSGYQASWDNYTVPLFDAKSTTFVTPPSPLSTKTVPPNSITTVGCTFNEANLNIPLPPLPITIPPIPAPIQLYPTIQLEAVAFYAYQANIPNGWVSVNPSSVSPCYVYFSDGSAGSGGLIANSDTVYPVNIYLDNFFFGFSFKLLGVTIPTYVLQGNKLVVHYTVDSWGGDLSTVNLAIGAQFVPINYAPSLGYNPSAQANSSWNFNNNSYPTSVQQGLDYVVSSMCFGNSTYGNCSTNSTAAAPFHKSGALWMRSLDRQLAFSYDKNLTAQGLTVVDMGLAEIGAPTYCSPFSNHTFDEFGRFTGCSNMSVSYPNGTLEAGTCIRLDTSVANVTKIDNLGVCSVNNVSGSVNVRSGTNPDITVRTVDQDIVVDYSKNPTSDTCTCTQEVNTNTIQTPSDGCNTPVTFRVPPQIVPCSPTPTDPRTTSSGSSSSSSGGGGTATTGPIIIPPTTGFVFPAGSTGSGGSGSTSGGGGFAAAVTAGTFGGATIGGTGGGGSGSSSGGGTGGITTGPLYPSFGGATSGSSTGGGSGSGTGGFAAIGIGTGGFAAAAASGGGGTSTTGPMYGSTSTTTGGYVPPIWQFPLSNLTENIPANCTEGGITVDQTTGEYFVCNITTGLWVPLVEGSCPPQQATCSGNKTLILEGATNQIVINQTIYGNDTVVDQLGLAPVTDILWCPACGIVVDPFGRALAGGVNYTIEPVTHLVLYDGSGNVRVAAHSDVTLVNTTYANWNYVDLSTNGTLVSLSYDLNIAALAAAISMNTLNLTNTDGNLQLVYNGSLVNANFNPAGINVKRITLQDGRIYSTLTPIAYIIMENPVYLASDLMVSDQSNFALQDAVGGNMFQIQTLAGRFGFSANYLIVKAAASGQAGVGIYVDGSNADQDLYLVPKGAGNVYMPAPLKLASQTLVSYSGIADATQALQITINGATSYIPLGKAPAPTIGPILSGITTINCASTSLTTINRQGSALSSLTASGSDNSFRVSFTASSALSTAVLIGQVNFQNARSSTIHCSCSPPDSQTASSLIGANTVYYFSASSSCPGSSTGCMNLGFVGTSPSTGLSFTFDCTCL